MPTYKYFIEPNGHLHGATHKQTLDILEEMYSGWSKFCGIRFERVSTAKKAKFKMYFRNNAWMKWAGGTESTPLGLAWRGGTMWYNNERRVDWFGEFRWVGQALFAHEHRHVFGDGHDNDKDAILNPNLTSDYWSASEIAKDMRRFGKPKVKWYPLDRGRYGKAIRAKKKELKELEVERKKLVAIRNGSRDIPFRKATHAKVLKNLTAQRAIVASIKPLRQAWFATNNYWKKANLYLCHIG